MKYTYEIERNQYQTHKEFVLIEWDEYDDVVSIEKFPTLWQATEARERWKNERKEERAGKLIVKIA